RLSINAWYVSAFRPHVTISTPLPSTAYLLSASADLSASQAPNLHDTQPPPASTPRYPEFPLKDLVPPNVRINKRLFRLTLVPLFLHDQQLGFAMLDSHGVEGSVVEALRASLSIALYAHTLRQRVLEGS